MRSTVIAVVLCMSVAAAAAECARQASVAGVERPGPELIIQTVAVAAGTPAQALPADDGLPTMDNKIASAKPEHQHYRRAGPAMLLAALALMSGIALRRFTARMQ